MSDTDELKEDAEAFVHEAFLWLENGNVDMALYALRIVERIEEDLARLAQKEDVE